MSRGHRGDGVSYISIFNGVFEQRFKEPNEKTKVRTTNKGNKINVEQFDTFTGYIENIAFDTQNEYGPKMLITVMGTNGEKIQIQVKLDSGYSIDFLMRVGNLDLSQTVFMAPVYIEENDRKKTFFSMKQNGVKIERKYTKDTPGMPEWERVQDDMTGKVTFKKGKQVKWLMDRCNELVFPTLPPSESGNSGEPLPKPVDTSIPAVEPSTDVDAEDDLPF